MKYTLLFCLCMFVGYYLARWTVDRWPWDWIIGGVLFAALAPAVYLRTHRNQGVV